MSLSDVDLSAAVGVFVVPFVRSRSSRLFARTPAPEGANVESCFKRSFTGLGPVAGDAQRRIASFLRLRPSTLILNRIAQPWKRNAVRAVEE